MVCEIGDVNVTIDTNAEINVVAPFENTMMPPAMALVNVVPTPVIVVPD